MSTQEVKTLKFYQEHRKGLPVGESVEIAVRVAAYYATDSLYIGLFKKDKQGCFEAFPFTDLTVNLGESLAQPHEAYVDIFDKNRGLLGFILDNDLGVVRSRVGYSGSKEYPVVAFDMLKLKELDPVGVDNYFEELVRRDTEAKDIQKGAKKQNASIDKDAAKAAPNRKEVLDMSNEKTENVGTDAQITQWVNMKFPPGFVHPYETKPNEAGLTYDKAIANIPPGTSSNGIDLTGRSIDVFMDKRGKMQEAIANGEAVPVGLPADQPVKLFKEGENDINLKPFPLATALKDSRENYAAKMAAERAAQKEQGAGSLEAVGAEAKEAATALADNADAPEPAQPAK